MTITRPKSKKQDMPIQKIGLRAFSRFLAVCVYKHSLRDASVGSKDFYYRLISSTSSSPTIILFSVIYMTRLRIANSSLLRDFPGDLVYTACLMLAYTMVDDAPYDTQSWATLSSYSPRQLNTMTREICAQFDYNLQVNLHAYYRFESDITKYFKISPSCTSLRKSFTPSTPYRVPNSLSYPLY